LKDLGKRSLKADGKKTLTVSKGGGRSLGGTTKRAAAEKGRKTVRGRGEKRPILGSVPEKVPSRKKGGFNQ